MTAIAKPKAVSTDGINQYIRPADARVDKKGFRESRGGDRGRTINARSQLTNVGWRGFLHCLSGPLEPLSIICPGILSPRLLKLTNKAPKLDRIRQDPGLQSFVIQQYLVHGVYCCPKFRFPNGGAIDQANEHLLCITSRISTQSVGHVLKIRKRTTDSSA